MTNVRWIAIIALIVAACLLSSGCEQPQMYGREKNLFLPGQQQRVWAIAPVINLSGQPGVDALLQADLLFQQLQTVQGLTVIPVDRVAQVYAAAGIEQIQTPQQANVVLDALGCDGLIVATVTQYDPYNPPKFGAAMQLFEKPGDNTPTSGPDPRTLLREGAPAPGDGMPSDPGFIQVVAMYDAANGSVRDAVTSYASGRHEPTGPMGVKEYFANMDRYCGFAYYSLIDSLLVRMRNGR